MEKCRICQSDGPFHKSYLANSNFLCKNCATESVRACRLRDPARLIHYRASNALKDKNITLELVASVLERCQFRSVMSGETDITELCLVPLFRDVVITEFNCVILTKSEARKYRKTLK